MNPYSIPSLLTALLACCLGLFVLLRNPRSSLSRAFALWCFLTAYWQGNWTVLFNLQDPQTADTVTRLGYSGIIFIPIAFFHFVVEFTHNAAKRTFVYLAYGVGTIFLVSTWTGDAYVAGIYSGYWGYYPKVGVLHPVYLVFLTLLLVVGLAVLVAHRRELSGQPGRVNQVTYVFISTVIYSLAGLDFLMNYGVELYPIGFIFTNIHAGIITYAIVQYRLLDIDVVIKRSLIYACLLLALLVPCYLVLIGTQMLFFGEVSAKFSLVALALFILVGFFFPKVRFRTEEAFERVLFKKHYDYRETLLRSSKEMISMVDLETVCENLVQTVVKALEIEKASLFLLEESNGSFRIKSNVGLKYEPSQQPVVTQDDPLVRTLVKRREAIIREELEMLRDGRETLEASAKMAELQAEITLPLLTKDRLIGMLNLGHREGNAMYSYEDIEVLSTLANQAAIAIDNARLYENLKQSQNIIRRADRLSSLGMLTAGLAHEIRNPLVAIRTFTQLLPERYEDKDFRDSFQSLALKEVDRICGLVTDLLSFARPSTPNVTAENINEIVDNIARILDTEAKEKDVRITLHLASDMPKIFVDKEQTKQVCMNLILNAIQSIEGGGAVEIATHLSPTNGHEQFVQIEVRDSGVGIPEKDLENIFNPFFTTKKDGNGLGLSISHQIVKEHGGHIVVESGVGRGTTFFINLPLKYVAQSGAKYRPQVHEAYSSH
ncbi:MAG: hypothetical protein A3F90_00275 [Deltaproteobacteria bacterium RIFCSPLOWO2_12_FULL_60_19]|nr:MAG: hypothetical protein A3F90_00275 [Deltaproteobacteria bacterium RIFCSPLOWO2_12_FULL_60_19]